MTLQTRLSDLITSLGTDYKQLRTWITGSSTGDLTGLTTTDKSNLVGAINEVKAGSSGSPPDASTTVKGVIEIATLAEVTTGTDAVRAVTPQGVKQQTDAVIAQILDSPPGALDTLNELAAALGDDANFAATVTTSLSGKQPLDSDLTAIAALTTTSYGRAFLALADTAALMALISAASETVQGKIEIATQAETNTGTDDARALTPLKLATNITAVFGNPDLDLAAAYVTAKA